MILYCGFNFCFLDYYGIGDFFLCLEVITISSSVNCLFISLTILLLSFPISLYKLFILFWIPNLCSYMCYKYLIPFCGISFHEDTVSVETEISSYSKGAFGQKFNFMIHPRLWSVNLKFQGWAGADSSRIFHKIIFEDEDCLLEMLSFVNNSSWNDIWIFI